MVGEGPCFAFYSTPGAGGRGQRGRLTNRATCVPVVEDLRLSTNKNSPRLAWVSGLKSPVSVSLGEPRR